MFVTKKNSLFIATHPNFIRFLQHAASSQSLSPSRVVRINFHNDENSIQPNTTYDIIDQYLNNGEEISGASVAIRVRKTTMIGSVFEKHVLICNLKKNQKTDPNDDEKTGV